MRKDGAMVTKAFSPPPTEAPTVADEPRGKPPAAAEARCIDANARLHRKRQMGLEEIEEGLS